MGVNVVHLGVRSGLREQPHEHTCHSRVTGARRMLKSCSAPELPVLYSNSPLAIYFVHGSIYMSML